MWAMLDRAEEHGARRGRLGEREVNSAAAPWRYWNVCERRPPAAAPSARGRFFSDVNGAGGLPFCPQGTYRLTGRRLYHMPFTVALAGPAGAYCS
jgi:hypothetical protein